MKRKLLLLGGALLICGCQGMNHTDTGVLAGGGTGAVVGGVVSHALTGSAVPGALLGGFGGAVVGGVRGSRMDRMEERNHAQSRELQRLRHEQEVAAASQARMNVDEVIHLAQNGSSDQLIINTIRSRGARFHLTTDDITRLKHAHVSEAVINEMLNPQNRRVVYESHPTIVRPAPVVERRVIIRHECAPPPPAIGFGIGFHSHPRYRHRHCRY